jgi:hypothetical protein
MREQRVLKPIEADDQHQKRLDQLYAELAAFNKRIAELEEAHPEKQTIENHKPSATLLARRIDEVRCLAATKQLSDLLNR